MSTDNKKPKRGTNRLRRPSAFSTHRLAAATAFIKDTPEYGPLIETAGDELDANEARRLSRWLWQAAAWLGANR